MTRRPAGPDQSFPAHQPAGLDQPAGPGQPFRADQPRRPARPARRSGGPDSPASRPAHLPYVVVSPHYDDAALSVGGLLQRLDGPVVIVTAYGGEPPATLRTASWWDASCGFRDPGEAYRTRTAEDTRACALLGAERLALPHPDGPYGDAKELPALEEYLRALPPEARVLLPLGIHQPDHAAVRDCGLAVLAEAGGRVPWVYADLPYTGHLPERGTDGATAALARSAERGLAYQELAARHRTRVVHDIRLDAAEWAAKREAVLCYSSQIAPVAVDHGAFLRSPGPLQAELVWEVSGRRPRG
jgi:LmbE family N-acetylglucosaminyl deacetylase